MNPTIKTQFFALIIFSSTQLLNTQYPEPYNSIKILPYKSHGWFEETNKKHLIQFIKELEPSTIIEVGSWLGSSTLEMARHLKKGSRLYAVDTWLGSIEHHNNPLCPECQEFLPTLYQQFLSNVIHENLMNIIIPLRMESIEAANAFKDSAQLIYLDAAHDTESVFKDIINWFEHLDKGGIMCGDDWRWQSIQKAVIDAAAKLKAKYFYSDNFWYFEPKK